MVEINNSQERSMRAFLAAFANPMLAADIAASLNCEETDAVAALLDAFGLDGAAETWLEQHALDDDAGDGPHSLISLRQKTSSS